MKILIYLIVIISLSSCMTVNRVKKNCDLFASVCVVDTKTETVIRDTTIYRDRLIPVNVKSDPVIIRDTIKITNNNNNPIHDAKAGIDPIHKEEGLIIADVWVEDNILFVDVRLKDSTILVAVHDTIFVEKAIKETTTEKTIVPPPEQYVAWYHKLSFRIVLFGIIFAIGYAVMKIKGLTFSALPKIGLSLIKKLLHIK